MKIQSTFLISFAFTLLGACSTRAPFFQERGLASESLPASCKMNFSNPVTQITQTTQINGRPNKLDVTPSHITASCLNGFPRYSYPFYTQKTGNSTFHVQFTRQGTASFLDSETMGLYAEPVVVSRGAQYTAKFANSQEPSLNFETKLSLNPDLYKLHLEYCQRANEPIEIKTAETVIPGTTCSLRYLPKSPVAATYLGQLPIQTATELSCLNGQPQYTVVIDSGTNEIEALQFSASDGVMSGAINYRQFVTSPANRSPGELKDARINQHNINIYDTGKITFNLKNKRKLSMTFDKDTLLKHKDWCQIIAQTISYSANAPGSVTSEINSDDSVPVAE